jgi:hypothetical protein
MKTNANDDSSYSSSQYLNALSYFSFVQYTKKKNKFVPYRNIIAKKDNQNEGLIP